MKEVEEKHDRCQYVYILLTSTISTIRDNIANTSASPLASGYGHPKSVRYYITLPVHQFDGTFGSYQEQLLALPSYGISGQRLASFFMSVYFDVYSFFLSRLTMEFRFLGFLTSLLELAKRHSYTSDEEEKQHEVKRNGDCHDINGCRNFIRIVTDRAVTG